MEFASSRRHLRAGGGGYDSHCSGSVSMSVVLPSGWSSELGAVVVSCSSSVSCWVGLWVWVVWVILFTLGLVEFACVSFNDVSCVVDGCLRCSMFGKVFLSVFYVLFYGVLRVSMVLYNVCFYGLSIVVLWFLCVFIVLYRYYMFFL